MRKATVWRHINS